MTEAILAMEIILKRTKVQITIGHREVIGLVVRFIFKDKGGTGEGNLARKTSRV